MFDTVPAYGMLIGMVAAMAIDASVLAYDEPSHERHARHATSTFAPSVAVDRRGHASGSPARSETRCPKTRSWSAGAFGRA